ncbi:hypothetical protein HMPREF3101_06380 [Corynebacterium sp. HMSC29G08]|nr:hypothetical protein HMPREF3101_06380 [Corynebacterium sp. HMSC29G08]
MRECAHLVLPQGRRVLVQPDDQQRSADSCTEEAAGDEREEADAVQVRVAEDGGRDCSDDYLIERVLKIRGLLDTGIPLRIISGMLPCLNDTTSPVIPDADPEL